MYSYDQILKNKRNFRWQTESGKGNMSNIYDNPSLWFFHPMFYFESTQGLLGVHGIDFAKTKVEYKNGNSSGILPWNGSENMLKGARDIKDAIYSQYLNTAYNFLVINDELERAQLLKEFIKLLSNINTYSPWYWQEITGLDSAMERKMYGKEFKIEEDRPKIQIKCLPDATDERIGTLLDLYKAICWSHSMKREIIPSNLRRFDMGIYIFQPPTAPINSGAQLGVEMADDNTFYSNCKYVELIGCEIDMNSSKSPYATLSQVEGNTMEYTIDISFDDVYEARYNSVVMRTIGDYMIADMQSQGTAENGGRDGYQGVVRTSTQAEVERRADYYNSSVPERDIDSLGMKPTEEGLMGKMFGGALSTLSNKADEAKELVNRASNFTSNVINQGIGMVDNITSSIVNRIALGNLWYSPLGEKVSAAVDIAKDFATGNITGAVARTVNEVEKSTGKNINGYLWEKTSDFVNDVSDSLNEKVMGKKETPQLGKLWESRSQQSQAQSIGNSL